MADLELSERSRRGALKRWEAASPEERSRNTEAARAKRAPRGPGVQTNAQRIAELEARLAYLEQMLGAAA